MTKPLSQEVKDIKAVSRDVLKIACKTLPYLKDYKSYKMVQMQVDEGPSLTIKIKYVPNKKQYSAVKLLEEVLAEVEAADGG